MCLSYVGTEGILLVASEDAVPDSGEPGLISRGTKGFGSTIQTKAWKDDLHFSVEHIAPQSKSKEWEAALYDDDPQTVDRLGNLILLPAQVNTYISNRSWEQKRLLYRYFSSDTPADAEIVAQSFGPAGLNISEAGKQILGSSKYMPMCKAIGRVDKAWSLEMIDKRGARVASLAYDRVVSWLSPATT